MAQMEFLPQLAVRLVFGISLDVETLSESAKELILSSWRGKTSRAYDSHFQKWLGLCSERGCDPVSGPISDVVNFLADLHSQGIPD